jgi:predicted enzyme related to lactoylglutathione lyase
MATTTDSILGKVLWYELLTTDVKAAEKFYADIVGWTTAPFEGGGGGEPYDVLSRPGGGGIGGVMPIPKGMNFPPHWGMYIGVPKLEEAVADIERHGGSTLSPLIQVPQVGRMRTMRDPQGAAFSILEPAMPGTPENRTPEIGDVSWHELYTTDAAAALKFYGDVFGWPATEALDMGEMGKYYMFGSGERFGGGMMNKPPEMAHVPTAWGFYFRVPDVHAAAERVKAGGGKILNGPMEVPGGDWVVNCMDPQGAAFGLHHKKA